MNTLTGTLPAHLMHDARETEGSKRNVLGKDDFLRLLMTQLKNQDPLNPKDHEQFTAQLAQFSSLEQLSNIGKGIDHLKGNRSEEAKLQALGMIGRRVEAGGGNAELLEGQPVSLRFEQRTDVTPVKAAVYDPQGNLVRELNLIGDASEVSWDGKDQQGRPMPSGSYRFRVYGVNAQGQSTELSTKVEGEVTGVDVQGERPALMVRTDSGVTRIELGSVTSVSLGGEKSPPKGNQPQVKAMSPLTAGQQPAPEEAAEPTSPEDVFQRPEVATWGRIER